MKTLYIDCKMGAAGDMLFAALLELLPDPAAALRELAAAGIPQVCIKAAPCVKCGIKGTQVSVFIDGETEQTEAAKAGHDHAHHDHDHHKHDHNHDHNHDDHVHHEHDHGQQEAHVHHHSRLEDILQIISGLQLPQKVREDATAVYKLLAEAEGHAHGVPVSDIHFHEVGTMDAIADITGVAYLMYLIAPEQVVASPVHVGSGQVRCAHGILPVPAPATAYLLREIPIYGGEIAGELCTPTGAALLRYFAASFGNMPVMRTNQIGYGMGKKDFPAANCVRIFLGETEEASDDRVTELKCNLDDMTPEAIGYAMNCLYEAGALEVYTVPVGMKKNRPGTLLCVIGREADREKLIRTLFQHTTTLGIRENVLHRETLVRRCLTVSTPFGDVRKKISGGYGVVREKYEYEDLIRVAKEQKLSLDEVQKLLLAAEQQPAQESAQKLMQESVQDSVQEK